MAEAVEAALPDKLHLIVEAGTGTGKTLAYLVPARQSGKRVVIPTGSRTLQEQLFLKDEPCFGWVLDTNLLKFQGRKRAVSSTKGRSCWQHKIIDPEYKNYLDALPRGSTISSTTYSTCSQGGI